MALIDILLQPLSLVLIAIAFGAVVAIVIVMRGGAIGLKLGGNSNKKSIDVRRTRDKRAFTMPITSETEIALHCPKKEGVHWRFYKSGPGWTYPNGSAKFDGIEGSAFTSVIKNDKPVTLKLAEALRILWGEVAYDNMPKPMKEVVEKHQFGVTVYPEKISDEDKAGGLSAMSIDDENDAKVISHIAKAVEGKKKMDWNTVLMGIAVGIVLGIMLVNFKVIKLG